MWQWAYAGDADMHASVHKSPWPSIGELAAAAPPDAADLWSLTVGALDLVRKVKTDASKSMAAPMEFAAFSCAPAALPLLDSVKGDIAAMLKIGRIELAQAEQEESVLLTGFAFAETDA